MGWRLIFISLFIVASVGNFVVNKTWHWKARKPLINPKGSNNLNCNVAAGCTEAVPHAFPHQVGLFIDGLYFCTGSLISTEWVLATAHCMDGAGSVDVVMGAHNIQNDPEQVIMTSLDFFTHENWNSFTLSNDIALIRLPAAVGISDNIAPAQLPSTDPPVGAIVTHSVWQNGVLYQEDVATLSNDDCNAVFGIIMDSHLCTDGTTCSCRNSGGLLNYNGAIIGMQSFGAAAGCESGYPDAFARVTAFLDWIQANTGITGL